MKIYRNSLFLCLILLFSFNASFAKEKWIRVDAPNFTLYGDSDEKNIKNVAFKLEQFRKTLGLLLPNAKLNSSLPTVVYVFKDDDSFKPFKPMENGKINERVAGYFFQSGDTNYIALSTDPRLREPFRLIFHEYFHFVMENNLDSAPIWVNEGLAEYYSTFEVANNNEGANIGKLINDSLVKLKSRDIIPLDKFFNLEKGTKDYSKAVKDGLFYPQAWAVVHFFLNANSGQRSEQFYQFVGKLNQGAEVKKSFQESFNADYKQIENELRQYLGKFQFNFIKYTFTGKLISESSFTSREISEAETLQKKGDLLVYSEQQDKSQKFLYDAIKQDPNLVSAHLSLGKLNLNLKRYQLARSNFEKAVELDPQNYLSHYYLGRFFMTEKDYENALKSYQKAIELKNDVPRLYIGLSNAQQALEKNDDAVVSIEKAVKIEPTNSSYHFTQSHLTLRLGKDMLCSLRASYFLKYKGWNDEDSPYAVLNLYFANRRSGTGKEKAVLKQAIANLNKEVWAYSIIKYLNGEIDKNALLNLADDVDKRTEANAYIGFDLLLLGKIEEAKQYLNWVKTNGNRDFTEYDLSISLLNSIEKETTNPQPEK